MLPACQIAAAPRSNPKSQPTVPTGLVSPYYMSDNWVGNVVHLRISHDAGWNSQLVACARRHAAKASTVHSIKHGDELRTAQLAGIARAMPSAPPRQRG